MAIDIAGEQHAVNERVAHVITCALQVAVEQYRKDSEAMKPHTPAPAANLVLEPPHELVKSGHCCGCNVYPVILYKIKGRDRYRCDACHCKETGARHPLAHTAIREVSEGAPSLVEAFARQAIEAQQVLDAVEDNIYRALISAIHA